LAADAPGEREVLRQLAGCHNHLGVLLDLAHKTAPSEDAYRRAQALWERLAAADPKDPAAQSDLAGTLHNRAMLRKTRAQAEEALGLVRQAIARQEAALKLRPGDATYRGFLCNHSQLEGLCLMLLDRLEEAGKAFVRGLAITREALAKDPGNTGLVRELCRAQANLAEVLVKLRRLDEAEDHSRLVVANGQQLVEMLPGVPSYRQVYAQGLHNLAAIQWERGRPLEAVRTYCQCQEQQYWLALYYPHMPFYAESRG